MADSDIKIYGALRAMTGDGIAAYAEQIYDTESEKYLPELLEEAGGGTAESTSYDNTESGLTATNVQDAIDELSNQSGGVNQAQIGYFVCDTAAATAAKTIAATGYALATGGNIRIKMTNANTADAVTLNINNTGAKDLLYNGAQVNASNSWEAGEIVEVFYDGTRYQITHVDYNDVIEKSISNREAKTTSEAGNRSVVIANKTHIDDTGVVQSNSNTNNRVTYSGKLKKGTILKFIGIASSANAILRVGFYATDPALEESIIGLQLDNYKTIYNTSVGVETKAYIQVPYDGYFFFYRLMTWWSSFTILVYDSNANVIEENEGRIDKLESISYSEFSAQANSNLSHYRIGVDGAMVYMSNAYYRVRIYDIEHCVGKNIVIGGETNANDHPYWATYTASESGAEAVLTPENVKRVSGIFPSSGAHIETIKVEDGEKWIAVGHYNATSATAADAHAFLKVQLTAEDLIKESNPTGYEMVGKKNRAYYGEKVFLNNGYSWELYSSNTWSSLQSCACFNDYLVEVKNGLQQISIYDLKGKRQLASCVPQESTTDTGLYHCNSCSFSNIKYSEDDEFPLLYIAQFNNTQGKCHLTAYRLVLTQNEEQVYELTATLVQRVWFPAMSDTNCLGNVNVAFDLQNGWMYTYSRNNRQDAENYLQCVVSKFNIPAFDATLEDNTIQLQDEDIIESFNCGITARDMQGSFIRNSKLYIGQGYDGHSNVSLQVIDLVKKARVSFFDWQKDGFTAEPEGVFFYNGHLMVDVLSTSIYIFYID